MLGENLRERFMAKKVWKNFLSNRPNAVTFTSSVSARLPSKLQFDKKKNKLPTPYALFLEWANSNLSDDWASTTISGVGFAIAVDSRTDAQLIQATFGTSGSFKKTPVGDKTVQCNYQNSSYGALAKDLGYEL